MNTITERIEGGFLKTQVLYERKNELSELGIEASDDCAWYKFTVRISDIVAVSEGDTEDETQPEFGWSRIYTRDNGVFFIKERFDEINKALCQMS